MSLIPRKVVFWLSDQVMDQLRKCSNPYPGKSKGGGVRTQGLPPLDPYMQVRLKPVCTGSLDSVFYLKSRDPHLLSRVQKNKGTMLSLFALKQVFSLQGS